MRLETASESELMSPEWNQKPLCAQALGLLEGKS